jgi:hypothetical protein
MGNLKKGYCLVTREEVLENGLLRKEEIVYFSKYKYYLIDPNNDSVGYNDKQAAIDYANNSKG